MSVLESDQSLLQESIWYRAASDYFCHKIISRNDKWIGFFSIFAEIWIYLFTTSLTSFRRVIFNSVIIASEASRKSFEKHVDFWCRLVQWQLFLFCLIQYFGKKWTKVCAVTVVTDVLNLRNNWIFKFRIESRREANWLTAWIIPACAISLISRSRYCRSSRKWKTGKGSKRNEDSKSASDAGRSKRLSFTDSKVDRNYRKPYSENNYEISIHHNVILCYAEVDRIKKHKYLWKYDEREKLSKRRNSSTPFS